MSRFADTWRLGLVEHYLQHALQYTLQLELEIRMKNFVAYVYIDR